MQDAPDKEELRQAVIAAAQVYFDERRARIGDFTERWFSLSGSLRLHRHALGWDILRAPANIALAPVHAGSRLAALGCAALGRRRTAVWLRSRDFLLETAVMKEVRRLVITDLLELPFAEDGEVSHENALTEAILRDPEIRRLLAEAGAKPPAVAGLGRGVAEYTGARAAVGELTTAIATIGAGAALFQKLTPGALTLGPVIAAAMAHEAAIASFPLGSTLGSAWYSVFSAPAASTSLTFGATLGLMAGASLFAAFAGVVADPAQQRLGLHRRRLHKLVNALEAQFTEGRGNGYAAREHYVARIFDVMDAASAAARSLRF